MWNIAGATADDKRRNIELVQEGFHGLRGRIPGLLYLEVGVDASNVDYACDVVLYSEFDSWAALAAYASHPAHVKVRDQLQGIRTTRHQVDHEIGATNAQVQQRGEAA
jgi:hypothetical protein